MKLPSNTRFVADAPDAPRLGCLSARGRAAQPER